MANGTGSGEPQPPEINKIAEGVAAQIFSVENIERFWKGAHNPLQKALVIGAGVVVGIAARIIAFFAEVILEAEEIAEPAFQRLGQLAVKDITGVDIGPPGRLGDRERRAPGARNIGAAILKMLAGQGAAAQGGTTALQPGLRAAEDLATFLVQMRLEGYLTGVIGEFCTFGQVESLGDLDDALSESLGLGRLARVGLRPIVDATIATPAEWHVNKTFRPELLSPSVAVGEFLRGKLTDVQLDEELARQGYSHERIEALINAARKNLTPGELSDAIDLGLMTYDEAVQSMRDQGYSLETGSLRIRLQQAQQIIREEDQVIDAATAAYASYKIDRAEFIGILGTQNIPGIKRGRAERVAELRRALNARDLSEGQLEEMVKKKILSPIDYRRGLQRLGYDDASVAALELLLLHDIRTVEEAEQARKKQKEEADAEKLRKKLEAEKRKAELEAQRAVNEPSIGQMEKAVIRGLMTEADYDALLAFYKYDAATRAFLIETVRQDREEYLERIERADAARRAKETKELSIAQLEAGVVAGHLGLAEFGGILRERGFTAGDADLVVRVLGDRIEEIEEQRRRREEAEARLKASGLSLSQAEDAVLRGLGTIDEFDAWLRGQRFNEFDRAVLRALLAAKLQEHDAQRAKRAEAEARAKNRGVPIADLERAVLAGIRPIADYRGALAGAGFELSAIETMVQLLELEARSQEEAKRKREEAERRAAERNLSLSDLARAVRWQVISIMDYRAALAALGYRGPDQDIIVETLVREIQAQRAAEAKRRELEEASRGVGLSLAQFAAGVKSGRRSLDEYRQHLQLRKYEPADVDLLVGLLADELAELARQRRVREEADGTLAARSISLGDFGRAVKANIRTLDEYAVFLGEQGFDQASRSTLVALLSTELRELDAARILRDGLAGADAARALSVSQSERAVREELRTLDEHYDWLVAQGFSEDDAALLTALLESELVAAASKKAEG